MEGLRAGADTYDNDSKGKGQVMAGEDRTSELETTGPTRGPMASSRVLARQHGTAYGVLLLHILLSLVHP